MLRGSIHLLNDNHVFGAVLHQYSTSVTLFRGTLDFSTCTLNFNKMLQPELPYLRDSYWCTIKDTTKNQFLIVFLHDRSLPTCILTVNIRNDELTIVSTIEGPANLINATLRGDKLFGFEGRDTKNLIEFSLTDQTTRIHKIQKGEQFDNNGYMVNAHVWIGDVLLLRKCNIDGTSTNFMFDLVGLEWKKAKYELKDRTIKGMSTNDGNHVNMSIREYGVGNWIHQFRFKGTDSLASLICKAVSRYSQNNQQFFQWFQSKLPKRSKFCAI
ncbi:hypothetical protein M3Y95_00846000 [Aphelenchoides besseyi]|nr:hypothetical protein M3Y95_00846000 [Aphelenchoides besseyi]